MVSKFNPFQIKVIIAFILLALLMIGGGGYYLNAMSVLNGGLNINKIEDIDKIYGYSVYSDFYFRITKYDNEGNKYAEYSRLIPIKTKVGLDFQSNNIKTTINSSPNNENYMDLSSSKNDVGKVFEIIKDFAPTYGDIVSAQDTDYFTKSFEKISATYTRLYDQELDISPELIKNYYEKKDQIAIPNLNVRYLALENRYDFKMLQTEDWAPNIAEWTFADNNRVYLQYVTELKDIDLDDYDQSITQEMGTENAVIIRTISINPGEIKKLFIKIKMSDYRIETMFHDDHGYLYGLFFQAKNKKALTSYMSDYLKIAFGIYFKNVNEFNTHFIKQHEAAEIAYDNCIKILKDIEGFDKAFDEGRVMYEHFNIRDDTEEIIKSLTSSKFDKRMEKIKEIYGAYPSKAAIEMINKELNEKVLIKDAVENIKVPTENSWYDSMKSMVGFNKDKEVVYIIESCKTLECLQKLKDNKWVIKQ